MDLQELVTRCTGFEWDQGNLLKNWERHGVSDAEREQVFFNLPLLLQPDASHSRKEERMVALGQTDGGRALFVVFTVRGDLVRIISARDMNRKERRQYQP